MQLSFPIIYRFRSGVAKLLVFMVVCVREREIEIFSFTFAENVRLFSSTHEAWTVKCFAFFFFFFPAFVEFSANFFLI